MRRLSIIALSIAVMFSGIWSADVCQSGVCQCSTDSTRVNCDSKGWSSLDQFDFPATTVTLTLVNNHLKFDSTEDRAKIENLTKLTTFSLNENPLGIIPPFRRLKLLSFSLQDTSLTSAEFPSSYDVTLVQYVSLNNNKIRSIHADDFRYLHSSRMTRLHLDDTELLSIDTNAFAPLDQLQALSLKNNHLKSCDFLPTLPLLSSIQLDGNLFTSLPQQLSLAGNIKDYSFIANNISTIDVLSPLNVWLTRNYSNRVIFLAKNPLDCCSSQWFVRFVQMASHFVSDSAILQCSAPKDFVGKKLIQLDVNQMNCAGSGPSESWWTTSHIVSVSVSSAVVLLIAVIAFVFLRHRRLRRSRSGYQPIPDNDEAPYDNISEIYAATRVGEQSRSIAPSEAATQPTYQGIEAVDGSTIDRDEMSQRAAVPPAD